MRPKSGRTRTSPMQRLAIRLAELNRLLESRYGPQLPDDDAGRDDLLVTLNHLACLSHPQRPIDAWIEQRAPWLTAGEIRTIVAPILLNPQRWKADALAWRMRVTKAERDGLALTTIGAIDESRAKRLHRRKQRAIERKRAQRKAEGAVPRRIYEKQSLSATEPWKAEGISRRTWYRRRGTSPATP